MYFFWFIFFIFIVYYIESKSCKTVCNGFTTKSSFIPPVIFFIIFFLLIGLQFDVGTDYFSYTSLFKGDYIDLYRRKNEFFFYYLCCFLCENKIHPQWGFIILSLIQFLCMNSFLKFLNLRSYTIFFYLFFCVSTFIYNQTNGIRQYTAAAMLMLFVKYMFERKYIRMILSIYIASMFHSSAVLFIPVFFLMKIFVHRIKGWVWIIYLIISALMIKINVVSQLIDFFPFLSRYSHYLTSVWGSNKISLSNIFTKIVYIPFYLLSLKSLSRIKDEKNCFLFQFGFFSYGVKLICLSSPMLSRFVIYLEFFTIMPLYYLFFDFYNEKIKIKYFNKMYIFVFFCISFGLFVLKTVVIPNAEYEYESIFKAIFRGDFNL